MNATNSPAPCTIGRRIVVRGSLSGREDLVVEGRVEGTVELDGELEVAEGGVVQAAVSAQSVRVRGTLIGDVEASSTVYIAAGARTEGNVRAPNISIEDGAHFRGRLLMEFDLPGAAGSDRGARRR